MHGERQVLSRDYCRSPPSHQCLWRCRHFQHKADRANQQAGDPPSQQQTIKVCLAGFCHCWYQHRASKKLTFALLSLWMHILLSRLALNLCLRNEHKNNCGSIGKLWRSCDLTSASVPLVWLGSGPLLSRRRESINVVTFVYIGWSQDDCGHHLQKRMPSRSDMCHNTQDILLQAHGQPKPWSMQSRASSLQATSSA